MSLKNGTDAYDNDQLRMRWVGSPPIGQNPEIRMPDMHLREILPGMQNETYPTGGLMATRVPTLLVG